MSVNCRLSATVKSVFSSPGPVSLFDTVTWTASLDEEKQSLIK
jgi:hypothetical protein